MPVLNILKQSHDCTDSGRLFQTTGAHTLKARLANAVFVNGTAGRIRDADDILVSKVYELKSDRLHSPASMWLVSCMSGIVGLQTHRAG